jgi:membrane protein
MSHDNGGSVPTVGSGPAPASARFWRSALLRTLKEVRVDELTDRAAALTYYGALSIFPALLVLVSLVGLVGQDVNQALVDNLGQAAPASVRRVVSSAITNLQRSQHTAGVLAVVGLLAALWSASGYVAAFMRASNAVYDVPEGRPIWKTLPIRFAITVLLMFLVAASLVGVVLTGGLARRVGSWVGWSTTAVTVWDIAKWPVLLVVVSGVFALLFWASPNVKQPFRWISPGVLLAVVLWVLASAGFAVYVANFASYNKVYGSVTSVIIFLVWLWISNLALLLGEELNAEVERGRAVLKGHPFEEEPYVTLRDAPTPGVLAQRMERAGAYDPRG